LTLIELFKQLREAPSEHAFTVIAVPGQGNVYLGADKVSRPSLFVRTAELSVEPPLRTSHVSLQLGQTYRVAPVGEAVREEKLDSLRCEASNIGDIETFLVLAGAFLARYELERIDRNRLAAFFGSMVRLFSTISASDLQRERQGLWGELFMMKCVKGFEFWVPSWHSETTQKFDFSIPGRHIEVKTTVGTERIHHFSHRQIYALPGEEILIASLMLRKEDAGLSLRELILQAREAFQGTEHYLKLELAVRQAGMEATGESGPAYDATEAQQNLAWYRSTEAPHFQMPEPTGVSQTNYRVDLSIAPKVNTADLSNWLLEWASPQVALARARSRLR
jgi:putative PD-(D/E)XK family protein DUF4420